MENLPKDVLVLLAMELSYPEILKFCQTNKKIDRAVCENIYFWINKYPSSVLIEDRDYKKFKKFIALGRKALANIPDQNFQNSGFGRIRHIKQELVDFLLNADFGDYKSNGIVVPLNYILFPLLDNKFLNMASVTKLFTIYLMKYKITANGQKFFQAGPEMNRYLNKQLTELENDKNKSFDRNKFRFNKIPYIISKLFESGYVQNPTTDMLLNIGKVQYILRNL